MGSEMCIRDRPMTEAAKEAKRIYYRAYYQKNRERILQHNKAYWERKSHAEQQKEGQCRRA